MQLPHRPRRKKVVAVEEVLHNDDFPKRSKFRRRNPKVSEPGQRMTDGRHVAPRVAVEERHTPEIRLVHQRQGILKQLLEERVHGAVEVTQSAH